MTEAPAWGGGFEGAEFEGAEIEGDLRSTYVGRPRGETRGAGPWFCRAVVLRRRLEGRYTTILLYYYTTILLLLYHYGLAPSVSGKYYHVVLW